VRTNATPPKKPAATPPPKAEPEPEPEPEPDETPEPPAAPDEPKEPDHQLAIPTMMSAPVGSSVGQFDPQDYDTPFLKLLQSTSPIVENNPGVFSPGDWIVQQGDGGTIIWQEGWEPLELTILRYGKAFMQQLEYGADEMPKLYATKEAAEADGLIPFGGNDVGYVSYADVMVLIKAPPYELELPDFTEEFGDDRYALAMWRITGMAYKFAAKKIKGLERTTLRNGLHRGAIKVEARLEKGKIRSYWVPQLRVGDIEMHSEEFVDFAVQLAG
jgi:hypothetical protein